MHVFSALLSLSFYGKRQCRCLRWATNKKKVIECKEFHKNFTRKEKTAWNRFVVVVRGFPENTMLKKLWRLIETLVKNYNKIDCMITINVHILDIHLDKFKKKTWKVLRAARRMLPPKYT